MKSRTGESASISTVTCDEVTTKQWRPFGDVHGVTTKTLWHDPYGGSYAGLLDLIAGSEIPAHVHRFACHHIWVASGDCEIGERRLNEGSYAFVPGGVEHGITKVGDRGCTIFYLYLLSADPD